MSKKQRTRTVIMGAAGRDFHNFNVAYRDDPQVDVVAFTGTQIPHIVERRYPPELAGANHPRGIPIVKESELHELLANGDVDQVVFSYSDVSHQTVMHAASMVLASGADFVLLGSARTMIDASIPVIAVSAVRTGCGKSPTARWIASRLRNKGLRVAVLRHPMPYGDLTRQAVQRFATYADLDDAQCSVEEREEYEPHLRAGNVVYAGVDYQAIVDRAQTDADVLLWDGGNNDFPFVRPGLHLVLMDALRPGHESTHHPGEAVLRMADVVVISKVNTASTSAIRALTDTAHCLAPNAPVVHAALPVRVEDANAIRGRRVLVVEDGPTITHGGMPYGAGFIAASEAGAAELVDARNAVVGELATLFTEYPHIGPVLPALGYGKQQLQDLATTIARVDAEIVVTATPCDLQSLITIDKPVVRATYDFEDIDDPGLGAQIDAFIARHQRAPQEK